MTRTDIHRPAALITEDYEYVLAYDQHPEEGDRRALQAYLARTGRTFGENHSAGSCYHCGARARYVAVLLHKPTGDLIKVGEQCLDNRFTLATPAFHALRKAAQLNRERQAIKTARLAWFAEDTQREMAYNWATEQVNAGSYGWEGTRHSFVHKINRYGSTSDKFVAMIIRDMERTAEREARRAAEAETARPVVTGKVQVTGEVLSVKFQDNAYGGRMVMTVRDDRGFKVWGSVPSAIDSVERGERVTFTATVEASDTDETFGFYKRPTKASILEA